MTTVAQAIAKFDVDVLDHLDRDVTVPVLAGLQFQGDVAIVPATIARVTATAITPVPAGGVPVVQGENGGNTHLLLADGTVLYDAAPRRAGSLDLGILTVPAGSTAYLAHPEHSYTGMAPGTYVIRRQREQADEIRLVAD